MWIQFPLRILLCSPLSFWPDFYMIQFNFDLSLCSNLLHFPFLCMVVARQVTFISCGPRLELVLDSAMDGNAKKRRKAGWWMYDVLFSPSWKLHATIDCSISIPIILILPAERPGLFSVKQGQQRARTSTITNVNKFSIFTVSSP